MQLLGNGVFPRARDYWSWAFVGQNVECCPSQTLEWPVISPRAHLASPISVPSLFSRTDVICPASIVRVLAFDFQRCPCLLPFPCR
jgi:hypothetical protein